MEIKNLFTPEAQQFGSQLAGVARKVAKPLEKPIQDIGQQLSANVQPAIQGVTDTVKTSFVDPVVKPIQKNNQRMKAVGDINTAFKGAGINIDDIKNLAEEEGIDFNLVLTKFQNNGIKVEGMESIEDIQAKQQEIPQGEDLGIMGNIKEGAIGALRAGEQIPTIVGSGLDYLTQNVTSPLVSGGLEMIGAEGAAQKFREASKKTGEFYKKTGEDITMAGMTDGGTNPLTQKQIDARKFGGQMALTAPIGGGYVAGAKGVGGLALRSGVVGAGFGATQPIIDKGAEATMGDIATGGAIGGVTGAVAGPLISKVIAPAIGGIASKTGKYGKALIKGGVEGAKKSIVRDVNAVKTGIQKGIQNRADIASTNINRMNAGQIRSFNEEIGVSPGKFLNDRGLNETGDDLVENLSKNLKLSRKSADEGLANIKGNFKAPTQEVATATVDDTGKFVTKQVDPVETMLRDNLENASSKGMSKESLRAKQLLEKYQEQGLSMTEINEAKRFLNANNKFSYFSDDVSPRKGFVTNLDNEVRKWQFQTAEQQGFTNLKDINKDTKAYYKLLEGIGGWQDKIAGNNPMGLTDWLAFNADPSVFLAKQVAQSNIAKRGYLKGLNALGGRKVQSEIKKPTNLIKNDIPNSNNSGNVPSSKRINVEKPIITPKKKVITPIVKPNTIKNESKVSEPVVVPKNTVNTPIVEKTATEVIKPKNSIYTSQEKAESYVKWHEKELQNPGISKKSITYLKKGLEDAKQEVELWKSLNKSNAKQQGIKQKNQDTINDELINDYQTNLTSEIKKGTQLNRIPTSQEFIKSKEVVNPIKSKDNITRNEAIQKGFSDSAKTRWDKGDFTRKEIGEAKSYLKSNYKGKQYNIDGKNYKVDAIDNRNEQVRLIDSNGDIIRVKVNNLPETKLTDKDVFDYYNSRVQKGYKTEGIPKKK